MKKEAFEHFEHWYDDYFGNAQGEDSPYRYADVKDAFFAGYNLGRFNPYFSLRKKIKK
jgi:hypothetical protein